MRKLAGAITPCQSNAAVTRFQRSPPAAKKVATAKSNTSARSAIGSRIDNRGDGHPALSLRAEISARSTWARQSACATGSWLLAAISSATAVAGRCASPLLRSSRRNPSATLGSRSIASGAAAMKVTTRNNSKPIARASGGSTSHTPAQENARNKPSAVVEDGQSRPKPLPEQAAARALERPCKQDPGRVRRLLWLLVQTVQKPLRRSGLRRFTDRISYHAGNSPAMRGFHGPRANPACDRAQSIGQLQGGGGQPPIARR